MPIEVEVDDRGTFARLVVSSECAQETRDLLKGAGFTAERRKDPIEGKRAAIDVTPIPLSPQGAKQVADFLASSEDFAIRKPRR